MEQKTLEVLMPDMRGHARNTSDLSRGQPLPKYRGLESTSLAFPHQVNDVDVLNYGNDASTSEWVVDPSHFSNETEYKIAEVMWQVSSI